MGKGAEWMQKQLNYLKTPVQMSELGKSVADLLDELFYGIYHMDYKTLYKVNWNCDFYIKISIGNTDWATTDFDYLTRLVFLAHHRAIRVEMSAGNFTNIHLIFHQRSRKGSIPWKHPTLDEAVEKFKKEVQLPEYQDKQI